MSSTSTYCYTIVLPKPVLFLVSVIDGLWLAITKALFQLGLVSSPTTLLAPPWDHVYVSDLTMHKPKNNFFIDLPVVKFSSLRQSSEEAGDCEEDEAVCGVCLSKLEEKAEVRELGNCSHVFHKECIDKWVNLEHLTCPMCRSHLLPSKDKKCSKRSFLYKLS
ncbi:Zinc finger RING/FYVE/PHD-type protein [Dioscorea alata]|uniref:Zinc finger RING/FYVE/PHD-type protein n=1 Tax=Dioscorea alata TaxID=55571 RepID=A0ACB7TZY5_DIOAL|nr:Zinc finger RING/FYVE/PHD-type protein [Dioscorea alata]